jgi:diguanylate cyclase (GGDEF)-like protein
MKGCLVLKISEFATLNQVTAKMLRHYDEMGLLKPSAIDPETGYRSYQPEQSHLLNWIIILKNLDFSLAEIKIIFSDPFESNIIVPQLMRKRIEISLALNEHIQKKIAIDRLITIIEKEGFDMDKKIDLLSIVQMDVHEIKKNIPNMEVFLETAAHIAASCSNDEHISVFRFDISHFKEINDKYGFDVGDNVIVACYQLINLNVKAHLSQAAIGRAHGDEFVVFAKAGKEAINQTSQSIIDGMKNYDFAKIGCPKQMGCYIGGLVGHHKRITDIRKVIEDSIETINLARKKGPNSISIESFNL